VTFVAEWVGGFVLVIAAAVATVPGLLPHPQGFQTFLGAVMQLISAALEAVVYVSVQNAMKYTPSIAIRYAPFMITEPLWNFLYCLAKGEMVWDLALLFDGNRMWWVLGLAALVLSLQLLMFKVLMHVDVLSYTALFAAKSLSFFILYSLGDLQKASKNIFWSPWLWASAPVSLVCCILLIGFASSRRQIASRILRTKGESKRKKGNGPAFEDERTYLPSRSGRT
jgi:hypothetical protein